MFREIENQKQIDKLRDGLANLVKWLNDWLTIFIADKCNVLHIRYKNPRSKYYMDGQELQEVAEELDLGVIMDKLC
jgi:hypothetical protein